VHIARETIAQLVQKGVDIIHATEVGLETAEQSQQKFSA
jgi:hypothetical protein